MLNEILMTEYSQWPKKYDTDIYMYMCVHVQLLIWKFKAL